MDTVVTQVDASMALQTLTAIEQSAQAVAHDAAQLVDGLKSSLQSVTENSLNHMQVYRDTVEHTMQHAQHGISHGRSLIEKCQQLDTEMDRIHALAAQLKMIKQVLAELEAAI
eukprot:CAMPEP_0119321036 /NCGR_PEP_ID=MMETSP1333-20130426/54226_1 /TAXON_ID=418940 /ORGANISM="Scyphosphaera apsteinii, Strain RCC1455" /LENGTH=112 /DNA_ID=CAMNT_0007327899 /DNA_START=17 /DNA_END=355 /DNA_ORIENTATION=-